MTDPKQGMSYSDLTGMIVSQVTDEVLYTGLIEMQKLDLLKIRHPTRTKAPRLQFMGLWKAGHEITEVLKLHSL